MNVRYNPDLHHRRSIRLKGYDYSAAGAHFVTICTQERTCLFGDVADGQVRLNDAGKMVETVWSELPGHYLGVELDEFIVMPNHVHGIIVLVGAGPRACPDQMGVPTPTGQPRGVAPTCSSNRSRSVPSIEDNYCIYFISRLFYLQPKETERLLEEVAGG